MKFDVKKYFLVPIAVSIISSTAVAASDFKIEKISYRGLKRISTGTVANYLNIRPGQIMTDGKSAQIIKSLYKTGFFQAVGLDRQGNILVVRVVERGTIGSITLKGNKSITSDQLKAVLKQLGLTKGNVFQ